MARRQSHALTHLPDQLAGVPTAVVPLAAIDLVGVDALRRLARGDLTASAATSASKPAPTFGDIEALIDALAAEGPGVTLVTGKGGVGKTSIAVRVAAGLARRGLAVHLATTDPAGRLPTPGGIDLPDTVTVSRIDPDAEAARYAAQQLRGTPEDQRELAAEDLRSPCTTEIAVFRSFSRLLGLGRNQHVVIDTAPTGHTLLLLDVTGGFHRQVMRGATVAPGRITTPLMRLQDPRFSRLLLVALAETTPVAEAAEFQDDLRRAGIEPLGWVLNAVLSASATRDPVLQARARLEIPQLERVATLARRVWLASFDPALAEHDPAAPTVDPSAADHPARVVSRRSRLDQQQLDPAGASTARPSVTGSDQSMAALPNVTDR